jgi:SOS response regulatory protein OraA/RecX
MARRRNSGWSGGTHSAGEGTSVRRSRRSGSREPEPSGPPADPEAAAREICLRLLSFSPRTRAQLADALRRKGVEEEIAERVLGRYTEVGLIDDEAFARAWVQSRHTGRGLARRALAAELRQRGVADETVKDAVEELAPEQEEWKPKAPKASKTSPTPHQTSRRTRRHRPRAQKTDRPPTRVRVRPRLGPSLTMRRTTVDHVAHHAPRGPRHPDSSHAPRPRP